jgi:hypothetical protein
MKRSASQVTSLVFALIIAFCTADCTADRATSQLAAGVPAAGMVGTGLEANGRAVRSAPAPTVLQKSGPLAAPGQPVPAPATATAPTAPPAAILPLSQQRQGKLESYILNNPSIQKAEQLRSDPRLNWLSMADRGDFLNEFGVLMFSQAVSSRDSLLARTHTLDNEEMEKTDRIFKFRDNAATFQTDQTALVAEIGEHNKKVAAYTSDLQTYGSDVANYNVSVANYTPRLADHDAQTAAHNAEVANYTVQCVGAPLPPGPYARCNAWQSTLNARKVVLDNWKAQLEVERARLSQVLSNLDMRKAALQKRYDDNTAHKAELDSKLAELEKRRTDLLAEQKKLTDWDTSMQPQWDFEVKLIDEWRAALDRFNTRLEQALSKAQKPTPPTTGFTGNWNPSDMKIFDASLKEVKDADLKNWIATTAGKDRFTADNFSPITASGSTIRFKNGFFDTNTTTATRVNLLVFEGGKVFWTTMQDKPLTSGETMGTWFVTYSGNHLSIIQSMREATYLNENLTKIHDFEDAHSTFGQVFRAVALQLSPPAGSDAKQQIEWNDVVSTFSAHIDPLLRGNP